MPIRAASSQAGVSLSKNVSENERSFIRRWKHSSLFNKGFVAVPSAFFQHYAHLKPFPLTTGEALFVLHLMEFKWDSDAPFPGYKTLALRMGVSDKMTRRYAQSLETKKYLRREKRIGQTNRFDLTPLFDALDNALAKEEKEKRKRSSKDRQDALVEWLSKMFETYKVMSEEERKELTEWERSNVGVNSADWPGWEMYIGKKPRVSIVQ